VLTTSSAIVNESSHIVDVCRWADRCGVGFLSPSLQRLHFACVALRGPHQHGLWALLGRTLRSACVFSMWVYVFHPATSGCFMWYSWTEQRLAVSLCTFSTLWVRSAGVLEGVCLLQTHTYTHKKIVKKQTSQLQLHTGFNVAHTPQTTRHWTIRQRVYPLESMHVFTKLHKLHGKLPIRYKYYKWCNKVVQEDMSGVAKLLSWML